MNDSETSAAETSSAGPENARCVDESPLQIKTTVGPLESLERARHNALQPLLFLNNEILSMFLLYLARSSPLCLFRVAERSVSQVSLAHRRLGWVNITHVCRRLRDVALGYPVLWTMAQISEHSASWLSELLRRSGSLPIQVEVRFVPVPTRNSQAVEDACAIMMDAHRLQRIGSFSIKSRAVAWRRLLRVLLNDPASRLSKLDIHILSTNRIFALPDPCFAADAPHLRKLCLRGFYGSWSSLRLPSLTTLIITQPYIRTDWLHNVEELWGEGIVHSSIMKEDLPMSSAQSIACCLRDLPLLETIILENALPPSSTGNDSDNLPILLNRLRCLRIMQRVLDDCSFLLNTLKAPKLQVFDFACNIIPKPMNETQMLYRSLTGFLSSFTHSLPSPVTQLSIEIDFESIDIQALHEVPELQEQPGTSQRTRAASREALRISLMHLTRADAPGLYPHRHKCLVPLINALPLVKLEILNIEDTLAPEGGPTDIVVDYQLWHNIYDKCSNATSVYVRSLATTALLPLLACHNISGWTFSPLTEPRAPAFPRLKHLSMWVGGLDEAYSFVTTYLAGDNPLCNHNDDDTVYLEVVKECLQSRIGQAPLLESLELQLLQDLRLVDSYEGVVSFQSYFAGLATVVHDLAMGGSPRDQYLVTYASCEGWH